MTAVTSVGIRRRSTAITLSALSGPERLVSDHTPSPAHIVKALTQAQRRLDRFPELAERQASDILGSAPGHPQALLLRGQALAALGRTRDAIACLVLATRALPNSLEAWRALAEQSLIAGDGPRADHAYAQQIRCSVQDPVLRKAAVALCRNDLPIAERLIKGHLKERPNDVAAIRMLAELAGRIGRYLDAENLLRRALELAPGFTPARFNLATVFYRSGQIGPCLAELETLLNGQPDNGGYRNLAAAALGRSGDMEKAISHYEWLIDRQPDSPHLWLSYGHALKTTGRQAAGVAAYRRCIALRPGYGEAWWSLANLKTVGFESTDIAAMEAALEDHDLSDEDRYHLHFALGKAQEDAGRIAIAFDHYEQGNRQRARELDYDAEHISAQVDRSIETFTADFFTKRTGSGDAAADPIFILGMPRAGSTLIEQILASHPLIEGTQELPDIMLAARRLGAERPEGNYPAKLASLDPGALRAMGETYLRETRMHRHLGRRLFIDKMPNNWLHIGLIHLVLPNAKIIDARRHPLGCCFSNFKQHFARGQGFSYDLETLGRYYRDYVRLMDHFDAVLPGRVHRVIYESLVDDTETEVRRLLTYVGINYDPACLNFYRNARSVRTASSEQVRRPINRDGMDQWRKFESHLEPLKQSLGPALDPNFH